MSPEARKLQGAIAGRALYDGRLDAAEALAPVRSLQAWLVTAGVVLGLVFFLVAGGLGASVTRPILELARTVTRLGSGDRGTTVPVRSSDEVGSWPPSSIE